MAVMLQSIEPLELEEKSLLQMVDEFAQNANASPGLLKCPTGIEGFDEITMGGLPRNRTSLVRGGPGCGKTLLAMEFLLHGILDSDEPGVFVAFDEGARELAQNVASLGHDLPQLIAEGRLFVDEISMGRVDIEETGRYGLEALLVRLQRAIDAIGAKRVAIDSLESFFAGIPTEKNLRAELKQLCMWLKTKHVTTIITSEGTQDALATQGLQGYVTDCVISLDNRVTGQLATRSLRVVKYRGSAHGTNEYPFTIGSQGLSVLPITALSLANDHAPTERISTGLAGLDEMLGGGCFRGSSLLIAGPPGAGKSSLTILMAQAACRRGEKVVYFAFEEPPAQIIRNMRSIGVDLQPLVDQGLLLFHAVRPTSEGLEQHLVSIWREVHDFEPALAVFDPVTSLATMGPDLEVKPMLTRMMLTQILDFMKSRGITTVCTTGLQGVDIEAGVSLLMDIWIQLKDTDAAGEYRRGLSVFKARGTAHSTQVREYMISDDGIEVLGPYAGPGHIRTAGTCLDQASPDRAEPAQRRPREVEDKRSVLEARVAALRTELEGEEDELLRVLTDEKLAQTIIGEDRQFLTTRRELSDRAQEPPPAAGSIRSL